MVTQMEPKEAEIPPLSTLLTSPRWWSSDTVAVVTGANKGIGFAMVKRLAQMGLTVVLTARDNDRGIKATESLRSEGLHVQFSKLDVSDAASIEGFVSWFTENFGALDVLVNNAAVSFNDLYDNSVDHADTVIRTNFYGPKLLTEALLPFFRRCPSSNSRILNISSRLGSFNKVKNQSIRQMLQSDDLTVDQIEAIAGQFLESAGDGTWKAGGWPEVWTDYAVSKVALNAYTKVLAKRLRGKGISVNCFCPGFTQTSMTRGKGSKTAEEAAEVAAWLALLPPEGLPTGNFFTCSKPVISSKL
ncbi:hypothetical protein SAY87_027789 [Trapa incisa]|uniref:(+)-neomenthol dehydrogenase n=1 Tax=Trapa incisa TaxID=236973 RepID=A0AAN7JNG9_9MYRT|nr:hypothetical protein SAY87_027789 [Trapa incisa]